MGETVSRHIGKNIRHLREARGLSQEHLAKLSEIPRATWTNLESGEANPTITVLLKVANALQVSIEELISPPVTDLKLYERGSLPEKKRGIVTLRRLMPEWLGSIEFDRMEFPPRARMKGIAHRAGTREFLICESGRMEIGASGETRALSPGDIVSFRGDQAHSYYNPGDKPAVAYSLVLIHVAETG
ncbi:MAG: XRE family transcriptional regulator [bacterium]